MNKVIFDLDGTIALDEHRQHFIHQKKKDWVSYFDACDLDKPNDPVLWTLRALVKMEVDIEIWSGRSRGPDDVWFDKTIRWLNQIAYIGVRNQKFPIPYKLYGDHRWVKISNLRMRHDKDFRPDTELKLEWLQDAISNHWRPELIFEDRSSVVAMWREQGIPCFQVAERDS